MATKSNPRLTGVWRAMKARCNNPNVTQYGDYGGRGIRVCKEWQSFAGFEKDMLSSYKQGLTLDRIDNNEGYSKKNCRWTTWNEQGKNKRNSVFLKGKTLSEWAKLLRVRRGTLAQRYYVYKWPVDKVLKS